jgi:hypothetical protein
MDLGGQLEALLAVGRFEDLESIGFEDGPHDPAQDGIVVDHQNAPVGVSGGVCH